MNSTTSTKNCKVWKDPKNKELGVIEIPKFQPVYWHNKERPDRCKIKYEGKEYDVRVTSCFVVPDDSYIDKWVNDSVVESVAGNDTEPDGWCYEETPSWLLVLGVI